MGKISEYRAKVGVANQAGDEEVSYEDYWYDMLSLVDDQVAERDNVITELRLYNEIVYQIFNQTMEFRDAGLSQETMRTALSDIQSKLERMNTGKNRQAEDLKQEILGSISAAERNITSAFASNAPAVEDTVKGGES